MLARFGQREVSGGRVRQDSRSSAGDPQTVTRPIASITMREDILELPWARSTNVIGTSTIDAPERSTFRAISI